MSLCVTVGLDLGQADFSALVVVESVNVVRGVVEADYLAQPALFDDRVRLEHRVRALRRWEPGTSYLSVVDDVCSMFALDPLRDDGMLVFDRTGVGRAVSDMFDARYSAGSLGCFWPVGIQVTGGVSSSYRNVAKQDLSSNLQVLLQQGRVRFPAGNPLTEVLQRELSRFRLRIGASGRSTIDIERAADTGHGDLTSALMLATYRVNSYRKPGFIIEKGNTHE